MKGLFPEPERLPEDAASSDSPLADRMRPRTLDEFVGQEHLVGPGKALRRALEEDALSSMVFWGPPGTGKTTLARILARLTKAQFVPFSAVLAGIKEIKEVMGRAESARRAKGARTVLFVDEIHRFNKAQQDAFLPFVERGDIFLIGATTENPSFELIGALLSRCKVLVLHPLAVEHLTVVMRRALSDAVRGLGRRRLRAEDGILELVARHSDGDARRALNSLEIAARLVPDGAAIGQGVVEEALQRKSLLYDKSGEEHYNLISALHKSMRNSDPDAALYWLARMIEGGEDPLYVVRRMIRFASEDVGLADPRALELCLAAKEAFDFIGPPEGYLAIAQAAVYLALAPKSNSIYRGYGAAVRDVGENPAAPVPLHIRNAVTKLMKQLGYGRGYEYAHDLEEGTTGMSCLPDSLAGRSYYEPADRGLEQRLRERLVEIRRLQAGLRAEGRGDKNIHGDRSNS